MRISVHEPSEGNEVESSSSDFNSDQCNFDIYDIEEQLAIPISNTNGRIKQEKTDINK